MWGYSDKIEDCRVLKATAALPQDMCMVLKLHRVGHYRPKLSSGAFSVVSLCLGNKDLLKETGPENTTNKSGNPGGSDEFDHLQPLLPWE